MDTIDSVEIPDATVNFSELNFAELKVQQSANEKGADRLRRLSPTVSGMLERKRVLTLRGLSAEAREEKRHLPVFGVPPTTHEIEDDDDFGDLNEVERRRRKLLDKVKEPPLTIIRRYAGTAFKGVLGSSLFWVNFSVYALFRLLATHYRHYIQWPVLSPDYISPLGGFMSFFVVFYVSQSYARFQAQYMACMLCQSRIVDCAIVAKSILSRPAALRLVRHVNAAHVLGYTALKNSAYTETNFLLPFNQRYMVLTEAELADLRAVGLERGDTAYKMAILWAVEGVTEINKIGPRFGSAGTDTNVSTREVLLISNILALRDQMNLLYSFADQPIPFIYVHMVYLSIHIYVPLFTYGVFNFVQTTIASPTWGDELVSAVVVFLNCLFILGLADVSAKLLDPFGTDVEDLSVMHYAREAFESSRKILAADQHHARPLDAIAEVALEESRTPIQQLLPRHADGAAAVASPGRSPCTRREALQEMGRECSHGGRDEKSAERGGAGGDAEITSPPSSPPTTRALWPATHHAADGGGGVVVELGQQQQVVVVAEEE